MDWPSSDGVHYICIQPWFRYFITVVPLEVLLVGSFFDDPPPLLGAGTSTAVTSRARSWIGTSVVMLISLLLLVPSSVTTTMGMANPNVGYEETEHIGYIFFKHPTAYEDRPRRPIRR